MPFTSLSRSLVIQGKVGVHSGEREVDGKGSARGNSECAWTGLETNFFLPVGPRLACRPGHEKEAGTASYSCVVTSPSHHSLERPFGFKDPCD